MTPSRRMLNSADEQETVGPNLATNPQTEQSSRWLQAGCSQDGRVAPNARRVRSDDSTMKTRGKQRWSGKPLVLRRVLWTFSFSEIEKTNVISKAKEIKKKRKQKVLKTRRKKLVLKLCYFQEIYESKKNSKRNFIFRYKYQFHIRTSSTGEKKRGYWHRRTNYVACVSQRQKEGRILLLLILKEKKTIIIARGWVRHWNSRGGGGIFTPCWELVFT